MNNSLKNKFTVPLLGLPSGEYFDLDSSKINFLKQKGLVVYNGPYKSWIFRDKDYKEIIKYISDQEKEEIKKFMRAIGITRYKINEDYSVDVLESVKLRIRISELPIKFDYIMGDFDVVGCGLNTLKNFPEIIEGDFDCSNNLIDNLIGGPLRVDGDYISKECTLNSLEGAPEKIKRDFIVSMNNINNLIGGPKMVEGSYCVDNCLLTSLEGSPDILFGDFNCSFNLLEDLKDGPDFINGTYDCSNNDLISLKNGPRMVGIFKCNGNKNLRDLKKYAPFANKIITDDT